MIYFDDKYHVNTEAEVIYKTEPVYVSGNPFTVGILNNHLSSDEKYYVPL